MITVVVYPLILLFAFCLVQNNVNLGYVALKTCRCEMLESKIRGVEKLPLPATRTLNPPKTNMELKNWVHL